MGFSKNNQIQELELKLLSTEAKLRVTKENLDGALAQLKGSITLIENWAYGPAFKKAGMIWPNNTCNAPALLAAKRFIKLYYEAND